MSSRRQGCHWVILASHSASPIGGQLLLQSLLWCSTPPARAAPCSSTLRQRPNWQVYLLHHTITDTSSQNCR
jgi:hypothetical protein